MSFMDNYDSIMERLTDINSRYKRRENSNSKYLF